MIYNAIAGDTLGVYNSFNPKNINTIPSPLTRAIENIQCHQNFDRYQHTAGVIEIDGVKYVGQAVEPRYEIVKLDEFMKGRNPSDIEVFRPTFQFDLKVYTDKILSFKGLPYDLEGYLAMGFYIISNGTIRLMTKEEMSENPERMFCSKAQKLAYHTGNRELFKNFAYASPKDFWLETEYFNKLSINKAA